ncbi:hypothetical protein CPIN18021_0257 [Campylobacter pinnipediorum subsp. caledonicus]|uniref:Uncharacterized protein n=1 Tax=Campylobacter pinnipediorum subsp. caledonicus TaxID=1874362 RepID=A0A1S6U5U2_9BACT|nr:hypothetical protein [Campylobacter pinnipediorum]AQW87104.1 hypothetical protein CPIN18021_0257 [Campylobacter pinnipediorum subsp. caledonicus]
MTLSAFKRQYEIITRGDVKIPDDNEFFMLMEKSALEITRATTPLELIEIDHRHFEVDYYIDKKYFVRKFKLPKNDNDEIDFLDKMLLNALCALIARDRAKEDKFYYKYDRLYKSAMCEYNLNNFDERSYNTEEALKAQGWLKPYDINYAIDSFYVWDSDFIQKLDYWMANVYTIKNLSYRKFIYLFIDYQNQKIDPDREDLRELDKLMKDKTRMD